SPRTVRIGFVFERYGAHRALHSFPTRRSSDLDGLFGDSRTDEDQIGASYDELEWAMTQAESGRVTEDFKGREKEVFQIYSSRNSANRHKMEPIPVCKVPVHLL